MQLSGAHFLSRLSRCVLFPKDNVYLGLARLALDANSGQAHLKATAFLIHRKWKPATTTTSWSSSAWSPSSSGSASTAGSFLSSSG